MKSSMRTFATGIVAVMILLASCAKDGKTGPQGATGAQGPAGTNGTNGTNGNANVISTNTVNVPASDWTLGTIAPGVWTCTITAAGIIQSVVDKGVVMVFEQSGVYWIALPDVGGSVNSTGFAFSLGQVVIVNSNSDGTTPPNPTASGPTVYRIIIIPSSMIKKNVNMGSYNEVRAAYNLKD